LGKLKTHFPSIPVIAVTATASDRVRNDVCEILRIGTQYRFFRSTFRRPNLTYSICPKPDGKDAVIKEMSAFIKSKYPQGAGIVYTYSRKDANTVANALCDCGVVAEVRH
jgi:superfamily II DNA helicase RecQ